MALVLHLKRGDQIIINGAVVENTGSRTISLAIKNEAAIMRSSDVLPPESAITPASRAYYALQCAYLFPDQQAQHLGDFKRLAASYTQAAPSASQIVEAIDETLTTGNLYAALKRAQALIAHEGKVLSDAEKQLSKRLQRAAPARQSTDDGGLGTDPNGTAYEGQSGCT